MKRISKIIYLKFTLTILPLILVASTTSENKNCLESQTFDKTITLISNFDDSYLAVVVGEYINIHLDIKTRPLFQLKAPMAPVNIKGMFSYMIVQTSNELFVYQLNLTKRGFEYRGAFSGHKSKIVDFIINPREGQVISFDESEIIFWSLEDIKEKRRIPKRKISKIYLDDRDLILIGERVTKLNLDEESEENLVFNFDTKIPLASIFVQGRVIANQNGNIISIPTSERNYQEEHIQEFQLNGLSFKKIQFLQKHKILFGLTTEGSLFLVEIPKDNLLKILNYRKFFYEKEDIQSSEGRLEKESYQALKFILDKNVDPEIAEDFLLIKSKLFVLREKTIYQFELDQWPVEASFDRCSQICEESACHRCHPNNPTQCLYCSSETSLSLGRCLQGVCSYGWYQANQTSCESCNRTITGCEKCSKSVTFSNVTCEICSQGYNLTSYGFCVKTICQDPFCLSCLNSTYCSSCKSGYTNYLGVCSIGSTSQCYVSNCEVCDLSSANRCSRCRSGYYLDFGMCSSSSSYCYVSYCSQCSQYDSSTCNICQSGYYRTSYGECASSNCYASNCLRCNQYDRYTCESCDRFSYRNYNGQCSNSYIYYEEEPTQIVKIVSGVGIAICSLTFVWIIVLVYYIIKGQRKNYKKFKKHQMKKAAESNKSHQEMQPIANNVSYSVAISPNPHSGNPE